MINREAFHQLLKRYVEGLCSEQEKVIVDQWYELLDDDALPEIHEDELNTRENRLWEKIQAETLAPVKQLIFRKLRIKFAVAASVIGLIVISFLVLKNRNSNKRWYSNELASNKMIEEMNSSEKQLKITLEDGSIVTLQPGSAVSYPVHFAADKREIYLDGEAFFEVTKNSNRPFYVFNQNIVAHVLGTSFNVKTNNTANQIEVTVHSGKVEVSENHRQKVNNTKLKNIGVILTPNQKVVYDEKQRLFDATLADHPLPLFVRKGDFIFDDEPLSSVLASLSSQYGIEIVVENNNLNNCPFTGDIEQQDLYERLKIICKAIDATYEIKSTKIIIRGKGCF